MELRYHVPSQQYQDASPVRANVENALEIFLNWNSRPVESLSNQFPGTTILDYENEV